MPAEDLTSARAPSATTTSLSAIPLRRDDDRTVPSDLLGLWLALAAALALTAWWFRRGAATRPPLMPRRRFGAPPRRGAPLQPVAKVQLTPQASLHVVQWHDDELLIACHPDTMAVLSRRTSSIAAADARGRYASAVNGVDRDEREPN